MTGEIKPGDVVKVKSGGPKMTVSQVGESSSYVESAVPVTVPVTQSSEVPVMCIK